MRRSDTLDTSVPTAGGRWRASCWVSRAALLAGIAFMAATALAVVLTVGMLDGRMPRDVRVGIVLLGCLSLASDVVDLVWGTAELPARGVSMAVTAAFCGVLVLLH